MVHDSNKSTATRLSVLTRLRDLNDQEGWNRFIEIYSPRILGWCRGLGMQPADAADAAQMVFVRLVKQIQEFEYRAERGSFRGWLKTITRHAGIDVLRQWRARGNGDGGPDAAPAAEPFDPHDFVSDLWQEIDAAYQLQLLREAEDRVQLRIKKTTWSAYRLTVHEQVPAGEAAVRLGISIGEVYVAKSRVLKMLRAEVESLAALDDALFADGVSKSNSPA